MGDAESSTSSSQTPKALGVIAFEPDGQQNPTFWVRLSGGSTKAPRLRVLENAMTARHKRLHNEMNMDITPTYLATKVAIMDTAIKKITKLVVHHQQETQRLLVPEDGMKHMGEVSKRLHGVEEVEIMKRSEEKFKQRVNDLVNAKVQEFTNNLLMPSSPLFTPSSPLELRFQAFVEQIDKCKTNTLEVQKVVNRSEKFQNRGNAKAVEA